MGIVYVVVARLCDSSVLVAIYMMGWHMAVIKQVLYHS